MKTKHHPSSLLQRWIIVWLMIFAFPVLAQETADPTTSVLAPDSSLYRAIKYVGKFHVLVIHFPIAFLLGAAVAQWHVVLRNHGQPLVGALLWAGTIGAVFAAALGWMYAYDSVYFGDDAALLSWHRWLGTSVALLAASTLIGRPKLNPMGMAITLTLCAALVVAAAHYGGSLVYGPDFLVSAP